MPTWIQRLSHSCLFVSLLAPLASTQNRDHPGLVPLANGEWGTTEEARERGLIEYRDRWYAASLEKKLSKWERLDAKGLEWDDAYKAKTKYYRVRTNVPRYLFELEIRPFLDALGDTYTEVFREDFGLEGKAVKNKDLRIYKSFEDYSLHEGRGDRGRPRSNPGFIVNGSELVVFYEETDPALFYATTFHEGAHQFFLSLLPGAQLPKWLNEALATWFEGATYSRVTGEITIGGLPDDRLVIAQQVMSSTPGTPAELFMDLPDGQFGAVHYALAWSFLHFLLERPGVDYTKQFSRFLDEANGSGVKPIAEVFRKATGDDLTELAEGWRAHVERLQGEPDAPRWVTLGVENAREDIQAGDIAWSLDGEQIFAPRRFSELWKSRPKDRAVELILVRAEPSWRDPFARRFFVRVTIEPESDSLVFPTGAITRHGSLRD